MITFSTPDLDFASAWYYLTDEHGIPCTGDITFDAYHIICDTPEPRAALNLLYEVKGFGEVMLRTAVLAHASEPYMLEAALAQGRRDQIERQLARCHTMDYTPSAQWTEQYANVGAMPASPLPTLMQLGEDLALAFAEWRLAKRIASGTNDLQFAGQAFGIELGEAYQTHFKALYDVGIAPFYFFHTRPQRDTFSWDATDRIVDWLATNHIPIEGSPLIWFHPYGIAPWMRSLTFAEAREVVLEQIRAAIARYGERVQAWEMLNEPQDGDANGLNLTIEQLLELTALIAQELKRLQPHTHRMLNFSDPFGARSYVHDKPSVPPTYYLQQCLQRGIEFETIGLQFYFGIKRYFSCRDLLTIAELLETFAAFGKDIRITGVGCPSKHAVDPTSFFGSDHPAAGGYWHGPWTEERQAEFAEKVYTLCAAQPLVKVITWWDFADKGINRDIGSRFIPHGGLLRRDLTPKPAYEQLLRLRERLREKQGGK